RNNSAVALGIADRVWTDDGYSHQSVSTLTVCPASSGKVTLTSVTSGGAITTLSLTSLLIEPPIDSSKRSIATSSSGPTSYSPDSFIAIQTSIGSLICQSPCVAQFVGSRMLFVRFNRPFI